MKNYNKKRIFTIKRYYTNICGLEYQFLDIDEAMEYAQFHLEKTLEQALENGDIWIVTESTMMIPVEL